VLSGTIHYRGQDLQAIGAKSRRRLAGPEIAMIFQEPMTALNPVMRVGEQIAESPRRNLGLGKSEAMDLAIDMMRKTGIPDPDRRAGAYPHELSGGLRQRIMIAMALSCSPKLLLCDEPTTALDVTVQAQILRLLLREVKQRGVSVLFTTHDLGTAWEICDRVVVMYAGQEVEAAPKAAFFSSPQHPYTAKLLDSLPKEGGVPDDIPGELPSLVAPPSGCRFHPRCDRATAECAAARPPTVGNDHSVRCFHPLAPQETSL
jgi:oligopeptide/dipeptide ABC transporter ATP-binding protein